MDGSRISSIGAALADPNRAMMLAALQSGRAHSAGELAKWCGIANSTASQHLGRLVDAGLVVIEPAGRHRYFRIASVEIADLLETIDGIDLPETNQPPRPKPGTDLAFARSCYDHLAGRLGVGLFDALCEQGVLADPEDPTLTEHGVSMLSGLGVDPARPPRSRRPLIRTCVDWTQRTYHLGGALGANLFTHMLDERWLTRGTDHRVLRVTTKGRGELSRWFGLDVATLADY